MCACAFTRKQDQVSASRSLFFRRWHLVCTPFASTHRFMAVCAAVTLGARSLERRAYRFHSAHTLLYSPLNKSHPPATCGVCGCVFECVSVYQCYERMNGPWNFSNCHIINSIRSHRVAVVVCVCVCVGVCKPKIKCFSGSSIYHILNSTTIGCMRMRDDDLYDIGASIMRLTEQAQAANKILQKILLISH